MSQDKSVPDTIRDYTVDYDYERLIEEEKHHFLDVEVTEDLREGGVHSGKAWTYYWQKIHARLDADGVAHFGALVSDRFKHLDRPVRILSLGSGYCGHEINLSRNLSCDHVITCTDINAQLFEQARGIAMHDGLNIDFQEADLNFIEIEPGGYDVIFAHASLHHVINLELLFTRIRRGLTENGIFHLIEVAGQNRKLIWDQNEAFANRLLDLLPPELLGSLRIEAHEEEGMEGVRQSEIIEQIGLHFEPVYQLRHGCFIRFVCTNPEMAARLDTDCEASRQALDFLIEADDLCVRYGVLEPLEIWGIYTSKAEAALPESLSSSQHAEASEQLG